MDRLTHTAAASDAFTCRGTPGPVAAGHIEQRRSTTMTTTRTPDPGPLALANVFSMTPTAVSVFDGAWQITHRGVVVGRLPTIDGDRLPFRALEAACEHVIAMELKRSDERARATAATRRYHGDRAQQLIGQRRRINVRVLARRALNMLDANELVTLADAARAGDDSAVVAQLRRMTGGALRRQQVINALASKTLELLGPDAIGDALPNRAGRRASLRTLQPLALAA